MRYFVVQLWLSEQDAEIAGEYETVTETRLVSCADADAVHDAIIEVETAHGNWAVFEMVAGRAVKRSVVFKRTVEIL